MITILEAIQQSNAATEVSIGKIPTLAFANLQEFNAFNDSFIFDTYPANVVVPFGVTYRGKPPKVRGIVLIRGWMITRIEEDTNDWRSVQLEPLYIDPMRQLAKQFLMTLFNSEITDPEQEIMNFRIDPEYMWLKDHLFGVSYSADIPVTGKVC